MKPIRYRILVAHQLSQSDRTIALAEARTVLTGDDAMKRQGMPLWGCVQSNDGRLCVLRYKGAEVALFFKRAITEVEPFHGDPIPVGVIQDPADAWVRFELLGGSSKQVSALSTKHRLDIARELETKTLELEIAVESQQKTETELYFANEELAKLREELVKVKDKLRIQKKELVKA